MRLTFLFVFFSFLFQRCKEDTGITTQKAVIKLNFTHTALPKPIFYSLKFGTGDTVYIKDHLTSQADSLIYAILTKHERSKIDSLIENMNLSALDTSYESHYIDGDVYQVSISKNDTLKTIYIHGSTPDELTTLTDYLAELKTKLKPHLLKNTN